MRATLFVILVALAPTIAFAQSSDSRAATARGLFQEGVALARQGEYTDAIDHFRRSQALRPAPAVAFNLASALVHTGSLVEASEILEGVLRDDATPAAIRETAERLRAEIAPRLARLTVRLTGDAEGVQVELDDEALPDAALGVPVPVDPGAHEIRVLRDEEETRRDRVELADGEARELVLEIAAREIPTPDVPRAAIELETGASSDTSDARPSGGDDGVWIGLGIGIAVLAAGAIAATTVVLTMPAAPTPVTGNAMPGVLTW